MDVFSSADNSPSPEAAREFLKRSVPNLAKKTKILGYEFMQVNFYSPNIIYLLLNDLVISLLTTKTDHILS
jgi:hypothetical protein